MITSNLSKISIRTPGIPPLGAKLLEELEAEEARAKYNGIQWYGLKQAIEIVRKHMDGKVLVPVEPTEAMVKAAIRSQSDRQYLGIQSVYQAMLKAAEGE